MSTSFPKAFTELMAARGRGDPAFGAVLITGIDPFFRTPFRAGETVEADLASIGVTADDLCEARTGRRQKISISVRAAAATSRIVDYTQVRGPMVGFGPGSNSSRSYPGPSSALLFHQDIQQLSLTNTRCLCDSRS
ncbi:hypothetical protein MKK75_18750 [Methylobacterium sp. J-030]|uniref:hypothetical protein n=1 Tax=Methylobacterium sp. J-030 TaxID=2836627 RepID=UPI001FBAC5D6|nr:hypothetical protein [Methylobacterium sp. J-030]MCJ2070805.1 hypothetical protein [Methylobacterium sp. J-030]